MPALVQFDAVWCRLRNAIPNNLMEELNKLKFDVYHEARQSSQLCSPDRFRCFCLRGAAHQWVPLCWNRTTFPINLAKRYTCLLMMIDNSLDLGGCWEDVALLHLIKTRFFYWKNVLKGCAEHTVISQPDSWCGYLAQIGYIVFIRGPGH